MCALMCEVTVRLRSAQGGHQHTLITCFALSIATTSKVNVATIAPSLGTIVCHAHSSSTHKYERELAAACNGTRTCVRLQTTMQCTRTHAECTCACDIIPRRAPLALCVLQQQQQQQQRHQRHQCSASSAASRRRCGGPGACLWLCTAALCCWLRQC